jgi:hypothetical protein
VPRESGDADPRERIRTLLLRTDNTLKKGRTDAAADALEEARRVAADPAVPPELRELVERRAAALAQLTDSQ